MNGSTDIVYIYIYTVEYHSVLKIKEFLIHAITWVSLENIMQVKYTCHRRINIAQFHLHEVHRVVRFKRERAEWCLSAVKAQEMKTWCLTGTKCQSVK